MRNLAPLIRPGGYIFVSGVDLDVRTRVARELGWQPLAELHVGDARRRPLGASRLALEMVGAGAARPEESRLADAVRIRVPGRRRGRGRPWIGREASRREGVKSFSRSLVRRGEER